MAVAAWDRKRFWVFGVGVLVVSAAFGSTACDPGASRSGLAEPAMAGQTAALQSIEVGAGSQDLIAGVPEPLSATGIYSDHTHRDLTGAVSWSVVSGNGSFSRPGRFTGLAPGQTVLRASDLSSGVSGQLAVSVREAVVSSLQILSGHENLPVGARQSLSCIATFTDGSSKDYTSVVKWTSSAPSSIAVEDVESDAAGEISAAAPGAAAISAVDPVSGLSATLNMGASALRLVSLELAGPPGPLPLGSGWAIEATGIYSDGSRVPLAQSLEWSSSDTSVAWVSGTPDRGGRVRATGAGDAEITALDRMSGVIASLSVAVSGAALSSLTVEVSPSVQVGTQAQIRAMAAYTDGVRFDLTQWVSWGSGLPSVLSVSNTDGKSGLATALTEGGPAVITASDPVSGVVASAPVAVAGQPQP